MDDMRERFVEAYDRHADAIYRHCYFRVYSREKAEDLVQETFLKTWAYLSEGAQVDNLRAFLYRVANNLIIDDSRRRKEQSLEEVLESAPALEPSAAPRLESEALFREVLEALDRLDAEDKEVVVLRYVDDLDPKEIAGILGITANNASVRLHRALEKLKRLIADHERFF